MQGPSTTLTKVLQFRRILFAQNEFLTEYDGQVEADKPLETVREWN